MTFSKFIAKSLIFPMTSAIITVLVISCTRKNMEIAQFPYDFYTKMAIAPLLSCPFATKSLIFPMIFALSWESCTWQIPKSMEIA